MALERLNIKLKNGPTITATYFTIASRISNQGAVYLRDNVDDLLFTPQ